MIVIALCPRPLAPIGGAVSERPLTEVQFWRDGVRVERGIHLTDDQVAALFRALKEYRREPKPTQPVTWTIPKCY